jgi:hypothetical protein
MYQRYIGLPVRLLTAAGVVCFALKLFGFIWNSASLKNRVDRRAVSPRALEPPPLALLLLMWTRSRSPASRWVRPLCRAAQQKEQARELEDLQPELAAPGSAA